MRVPPSRPLQPDELTDPPCVCDPPLLVSQHNLHHQSGIRNGNYGAITKLFDRMFGTLLPEDSRPFWMQQEANARKASESSGAAARKVTARKAMATRGAVESTRSR